MFGSTESPSRTRLLATLLLSVTFVAGGLAGAASERLLDAREPEQPPAPAAKANGPRQPRTGSILLEPGVFDLLEATPEQRAQLQALIAARDTQIVTIWENEYEPRMKEVFRVTHAKMREVWNDEQEVRLDSLLKARREKWRREHPSQGNNRGSDSLAKPK